MRKQALSLLIEWTSFLENNLEISKILIHTLFYPSIPYSQTYSTVYLHMGTKTLVKVGSMNVFAIETLGASQESWLNKLWYIYKIPYGSQNSWDKFICTHIERFPKASWKPVCMTRLVSFVTYVSYIVNM